MSEQQRRDLASKFMVCTHTLKNLLDQLNHLELSSTLSLEDKREKIKIIRDELSKVSTEIDNIKKEIKLLNSYDVN